MSNAGWTVVDASSGVWTREYDFGSGKANSFIVGVGDGRLAVVSPAMNLAADAFAALDGDVVALVAPNGFHWMGLADWLDRYPDATLYAPAAGATRIGKKEPKLPSFEPVEKLSAQLPDHVRITTVPHMKQSDTVVCVDSDEGAIWFVNDLFSNYAKLPSNLLVKFLFWVSNSGPGYAVNRLTMKFFGADKANLKAWLLEQMKAHAPRTVVPGHGETFTDKSAGADTIEALQAW